MSQKLVQIAVKYDDVFRFIADFQRIEKNKNRGSGVRELARIYYRAHPEIGNCR